jgi:hypothetical protein
MFDRPVLTEQSPEIENCLVVGGKSVEALLRETEYLYAHYKLEDAAGCKLVKAAFEYENLAGYKAVSLYLEAFGVHGVRSASAIIFLKNRKAEAVVSTYLSNRPLELRNQPIAVMFQPKTRKNIKPEMLAAVPENIGCIFVSSSAEAKALVALAKEPALERCPVVFESKQLEARFGRKIHPDVWGGLKKSNLDKIDPTADARIFEVAENIAENISTSFVGEELQPSIRILLRDVLADIARAGVGMERALADKKSEAGIVFLGEADDCLLLHNDSLRRVYVYDLDIGVSLPRARDPIDIIQSLPVSYQAAFPAIPKRDFSNTVIVQGRTQDHQVSPNIEPVIEEVAKTFDVVYQNGQIVPPALPSAIDGNAEDKIVRVYDEFAIIYSHAHSSYLMNEFDAAVDKCLTSLLTQANEEFLQVFTIQRAFRRMKQKLFAYLLALSSWDSALSKVSAVLVCQGRRPDALTLTTLAKRHNVPSFELQAGTISPFGNYVPPLADLVLVNDPFSSKVYNERLQVSNDRLVEVGSPRLDDDLACARELDASAARKVCFGDTLSEDSKIFVFATQPVPIDLAKAVFRSVAEAMSLSDHNWKLLLRLHPRETEEHLSMYSGLLRSYGVDPARVLQSGQDAIELMAADVIGTYYSTIGLEALALGRPVICVSPGADFALPFDLTLLGADGPVWTGRDLSERLVTAGSSAKKVDMILARAEAVTLIAEKLQNVVGSN